MYGYVPHVLKPIYIIRLSGKFGYLGVIASYHDTVLASRKAAPMSPDCAA